MKRKSFEHAIHPRGVWRIPNPSKSVQNPSKIDPESIQIGPKSIKRTSRSLLERRTRPGRHQDQERNSGYLPFWSLLADPGRSKGRFWSPRGSQKGSKIDLVCIGRHPGVPRRLKKPLQRGVRKGSQKVIENGSKKVRFWEAKNHLK